MEVRERWRRYVACLCAPVHAGSLCAFRVLFAVLMMLDTLGERSPVRAARRFADPMACVFSMFGLRPLATDGFHLLFGAMSACLLLLAAGVAVRAAGLVFSVSYWYLFLLQKTRWNNHSYLFGTVSTLPPLPVVRCRRAAAATAVVPLATQTPEPRGRGHETPPPSIPLWQLWLIRVLHFIVYFIAGCKKFASPDWLGHQSMTDLS